MIINADELKDIESKSIELENMSKDFSQNSSLLEKKMKQRKMRAYFIIAVIISVFLLGIYFTFFYSGDIENPKQEEKSNK